MVSYCTDVVTERGTSDIRSGMMLLGCSEVRSFVVRVCLSSIAASVVGYNRVLRCKVGVLEDAKCRAVHSLPLGKRHGLAQEG